MRTASKALLAIAAVGTGLAAAPASARTFVSIGIGAPVYRGYGYRPAYYPGYYPAYYAPYYGPPVYPGWYGPRYYGRYRYRSYYGRHWR
jgi:hypothetical protein